MKKLNVFGIKTEGSTWLEAILWMSGVMLLLGALLTWVAMLVLGGLHTLFPSIPAASFRESTFVIGLWVLARITILNED